MQILPWPSDMLLCVKSDHITSIWVNRMMELSNLTWRSKSDITLHHTGESSSFHWRRDTHKVVNYDISHDPLRQLMVVGGAGIADFLSKFTCHCASYQMMSPRITQWKLLAKHNYDDVTLNIWPSPTIVKIKEWHHIASLCITGRVMLIPMETWHKQLWHQHNLIT